MAGGRPRGSLNKKTQDLFDLCGKERIDPFRELLKLCKSDDVPTKLQAISTACKYLYPIRKAVEVSGVDGEAIKTESECSFKNEVIAQVKELVKLRYGSK